MGENTNKVGAVLVTGGSVAGIQASLDLSAMGYAVYLLEESSTLGGKIVPLDRNSSADDWTACFLSCKLNEVAENASIKTITDGKLLDVAGEPGRLKVTVLKKSFENIPRPVSPEAPETGNQNHPAASLELEVGAIVLLTESTWTCRPGPWAFTGCLKTVR
jgi:heterodisulfide reductase subunit A-like polyferredoxin